MKGLFWSVFVLTFNLGLAFAYSDDPDANLFQFSRPPSNYDRTRENDLSSDAHVNSEESEREYFDLSYTYDKDSIFAPAQRFDFHLLKDVGPTINETADGYRYSFASWSFCMSEHGGTHIDAPFHFNKFGWRLAEIPIQRLMDIPAVVIDVEDQVFSLQRPDKFRLTVEHILDHESKFGKIPRGAVVMVKYGWGKFWPDKQRFMGWDNSTSGYGKTTFTLNFPGMTGNAASWLLRERQIVGFGSDTLSADAGNITESIVHITLLEHQVYIIENIAYLDNLVRKTRPNNYHPSNKNCDQLRLSVLPIKTLGTGGPVRLIAYCKDW